jgi:hypothetical protein
VYVVSPISSTLAAPLPVLFFPAEIVQAPVDTSALPAYRLGVALLTDTEVGETLNSSAPELANPSSFVAARNIPVLALPPGAKEHVAALPAATLEGLNPPKLRFAVMELVPSFTRHELMPVVKSASWVLWSAAEMVVFAVHERGFVYVPPLHAMIISFFVYLS